MSKEIDAEVKSLKKIFTDDEIFYQIPIYQRPYSWNKDHVSNLLDDLIDAFENNSEKYFCGSCVLINNINKRYDVVDGQQRLTTFTILFCVLRDFYAESISEKSRDYINLSIADKYDKDEKKLKLLTDELRQNVFLQTVLNGIKEDSKSGNENRYLKNAHILHERIEEQINDANDSFRLKEFVEWMFESVVLAKIVCDDQDTAIQIFNVLNDRGLPLTSVDIIKSSLMISLNEEEKNTFRRDWENLLSSLEQEELNVEQLFTTYLYYRKAANPRTTIHKELLDDFQAKNVSPLEAIYDIKSFAGQYVEIKRSEGIKINCLRYLKHEVYWNSILCTAKHKSYSNYDEVVKLILAYYYQNWVAGRTISRIKQTSFNILKMIKDDAPIDEIKTIMADNLVRFGTTAQYKAQLESNNVYGQSWVKPVLIFVEYFLKDSSHQNFIPLNKRSHIEHILPQNFTEDSLWGKIFDEEQKKEYKNCLGNLTLLSSRKNVQASNDSFEQKKSIYEKRDNVMTSFVLTQKVFDNNQWTPSEITKRQKDLIQIINREIDIFDSDVFDIVNEDNQFLVKEASVEMLTATDIKTPSLWEDNGNGSESIVIKGVTLMLPRDEGEVFQSDIKRLLYTLFDNGLLPGAEIQRLYEENHSKMMLGIQHSLFSEEGNIRDGAGHLRYWLEKINGHYVCKEWWRQRFGEYRFAIIKRWFPHLKRINESQ